MSKISPCLWFKSEAEEAARFYVSLMPNSRVDHVQTNPIDGPGGKAGGALAVDFTLAGQKFMALNGGVDFPFSEAISLKIDCEDQAEIDRLWDAILKGGGKEQQCGWIKDRYGLCWQIIPKELPALLRDPKAAPKVMQSLFGMVKIDLAALRAAAGR